MIKTKNITHLKKGEDAIVKEFTNGFIACKLMAMGLLIGTPISFIRKAPFGGAFYIKTKNHFIGLRVNEAQSIIIE